MHGAKSVQGVSLQFPALQDCDPLPVDADQVLVDTLPSGATLLNLGEHLLKNVSAPLQLDQLDHPLPPWHQFPARPSRVNGLVS
jgi:hypothetical protein